MQALRLTLAAAAVALAGTAHAAPVTYSSRTAFNAALAGLGTTATVQTFEGIDPALRGTNLPDQDPSPAAVGYAIGGLTLSSPRAFGVQFAGGTTQLFTRFSQAAPRTLTFTFPTAAIAFGIDLVDYQSPDTSGTDPLTVTGLGVSQVLDTTPTQAAPTFFGVIDPAASATGFTISRTVSVLYPLTFDNVSFATVAPAAVPEPASLLLVAAGLGAACIRRRPLKAT